MRCPQRVGNYSSIQFLNSGDVRQQFFLAKPAETPPHSGHDEKSGSGSRQRKLLPAAFYLNSDDHTQGSSSRKRKLNMNNVIQLKLRVFKALIAVGLTMAWFGLASLSHAVSPAPDGCYPGFTTAEGCNALKFLSTGAGNTGVGWYSLYVDTTGSYNTGLGAGALALNNADSNTAVGAAALLLNTTGTQNTAVGTDTMAFNSTA